MNRSGASATSTAQARTRVGVFLAVSQFAFALGWIVYAAYLPQLLEQAGLPRRYAPWILALDQLIFIVCDLAAGVWSDRAARVHGHIARVVVAATIVSTLAFVALPWVAPSAPVALFLTLTVLWAATSSALRAPPLTLLGRHVARPSHAALVAVSALGLGLANALGPYLGLQLKAVDPRWPFLLSGVVLAMVTFGLVAVERSLVRASDSTAAPATLAIPRPAAWGATVAFGVALALGAAAFQSHVFLMSAPLYLRHAVPAELPALMPVFWVGFNLALWPAAWSCRRLGAPPSMAVGAAVAALALGAAQWAPTTAALAAAQAAAGVGWALVLCSAFTLALGFGHRGREGLFNGAMQSLLAGAALARLLVVAVQAPTPAQVLAWAAAPMVGFAIAAVVLAVGLVRLRGWPTAPAPVSEG